MADNRIYMRCKGCGAQLFLGKRFGQDGGYYYSNYASIMAKFLPSDRTLSLADQLNAFYDAHVYCGDEKLDCFEIAYEEEPDYDFSADGEKDDAADAIREEIREKIREAVAPIGQILAESYAAFHAIAVRASAETAQLLSNMTAQLQEALQPEQEEGDRDDDGAGA